MSGPVEQAIRAHVQPSTGLTTPTGRAEFLVHELGGHALVVLFGQKQAWTSFSWDCLEGVPGFLCGRGWVPTYANRDVNNSSPDLDGYLKRYVKRQTANYVAVVLEQAQVIELDRQMPAHIRLRWT